MITIVAPVGVAIKYDVNNPITNASIDVITDEITTLLNFLNNCIDVRVGNIINELINNDPTNLIPSTTIIEQRDANKIL